MGQLISVENLAFVVGAASLAAPVTLIAGTNITLTPSGNNLTIDASGGGSGITQLTGDITAGPGSGSQVATVAFVGGSSAANVHLAELAANAATSANTVSTIVKRDGSGNFSAGTITASLTGTASGNLTSATGVTDIHADSSPVLHGAVHFISGTNITLSQVGQDITIDATSGSPSFPLLAPDGTNTAPSYSFSSASNMGLYTDGTSLEFAVNGINTFLMNSDGQLITATDGSNTFPAYSFTSRPDQGFYLANGNIVSLTDGGGFAIPGAYLQLGPPDSSSGYNMTVTFPSGPFALTSEFGGGGVLTFDDNGALTVTQKIVTPELDLNSTETTGAQTATFTNSPVSGNPTTYFQVKVNGVFYWVAAWAV